MSDNNKQLPMVVEQNTGLVINDLEQVQRVANLFIKSGMFPEKSVERDLAAVCVKIIAGQELGLKPFQAMRGIDIIQGTPAYRYQLVAAKIKQSGRYTYSIVESTPVIAKIQFYEAGHPAFLSVYSMADANTEGLGSKDAYKKRPTDMLFARALTKGANKVCPELFYGNCLTPEDMGAYSGDSYLDLDGSTDTPQETDAENAQVEVEDAQVVEAVATKKPAARKPSASTGAASARKATEPQSTADAAQTAAPASSTTEGDDGPKSGDTAHVRTRTEEFIPSERASNAGEESSTGAPAKSKPQALATPEEKAVLDATGEVDPKPVDAAAQEDTPSSSAPAAGTSSEAGSNAATAVATSKPISLFRNKNK